MIEGHDSIKGQYSELGGSRELIHRLLPGRVETRLILAHLSYLNRSGHRSRGFFPNT